MGAFYEDQVAKVLKLDYTKIRPIAMLPFGYSEDKAANKKRRKVEDVFEFIDWGHIIYLLLNNFINNKNEILLFVLNFCV